MNTLLTYVQLNQATPDRTNAHLTHSRLTTRCPTATKSNNPHPTAKLQARSSYCSTQVKSPQLFSLSIIPRASCKTMARSGSTFLAVAVAGILSAACALEVITPSEGLRVVADR